MNPHLNRALISEWSTINDTFVQKYTVE